MQRAMKRRADQDECSGSTSSSVKPISTHLPRPTPVTKDGVRMWEVEEVLDEDTEMGHVHVKWLGYSKTTWEPIEHVPDIFVDVYRKRHLYLSAKMMKKRNGKSSDVMAYKYKGVLVKVDSIQESFVCEGIRQFGRDVIEGLQRRFPSDSGSILSCFDIFHLESLPSGEDAQQKWADIKDTYVSIPMPTWSLSCGRDEDLFLIVLADVVSDYSKFAMPFQPTSRWIPCRDMPVHSI